MSDVIADLELDHARISKLLNDLESEILAIEVGKTPDHHMMQAIMRYVATCLDRFHHPTEDLIFAQLMICDPGVCTDIEALLEEHVRISLFGSEFSGLLRAFDDLSVAPRQRLGSSGSRYIRTLREHMSREEERWFPLARQLLSDGQWQVIDETVRRITNSSAAADAVESSHSHGGADRFGESN